MTTTSYAISKNLYLVKHQIAATAPKVPAKEPPVNHIAIVDCSGSMYSELPKIREQMKKRLPKLLKEGDTLSVIWFSGKSQYGVLLEAEPVATLKELNDVNKAIDRWLQPIGLTGFKEPIEEANRLIERISKKNSNPFALFFMSDGYDNQWGKNDILDAMSKASDKIGSTTIVEYGNYADRQLLAKMAEKAGGALISAESFDKYEPVFEAAMLRKVSGAKRVEVPLKGDPIGGFAFAVDQANLLTFEVSDGKIGVPEDASEIWYLSPTQVGVAGTSLPNQNTTEASSGLYAAISLFSTRMQSNVVMPLLKASGDVRFIEQFASCFGKQRYSEFSNATLEAAVNPDLRCISGWDPSRVPPDDAFTILDFLQVLNSDDSNRVLLDAKEFKYARIGRPAIPVVEKDEAGNDIPALEFKAVDAEDGYSVSTLTYNETRPNISIQVRKEGTVDLSKRLKGTGFEKKLDKNFKTFVFRNYTIIRDGIVNVDKLPVRMTAGTIRKLVDAGFPMGAVSGIDGEDTEKVVTRLKKAGNDRAVSFVVDLRAIPIVNRNMVKEASAKTLFEKQWALTKARAAQKVLNDVKKEKFPRESEGFKVVFGEEAAEWLKEQGITDYSGFGPKTVRGDASDKYMGKELHVALKGLSSLPSVKEAREKIASGKTTPRHELLRPMLTALDQFEASDVFAKAKDKNKVLQGWLDDQITETKKEVRKLLYEVSQIRFGVIVGQSWFTEWKSLDENSMSLTIDNQVLNGTIEMKEIEVEI